MSQPLSLSSPAMPPLAGAAPAKVQSAAPSTGAADDSAQLREVAQQFEAIFLRQMLTAARNSSLGENDLFSSQGEDSFAEMRDAQFADLAARSGMLGFGASIEKQLAAHAGLGG